MDLGSATGMYLKKFINGNNDIHNSNNNINEMDLSFRNILEALNSTTTTTSFKTTTTITFEKVFAF